MNEEEIPKIRDYEDHLFVVIEDIIYGETNELEMEQLNLVLLDNLVLSFRESESNVHSKVISKLKKGASIRKNGADDLLYALIDTVVDDYFNYNYINLKEKERNLCQI